MHPNLAPRGIRRGLLLCVLLLAAAPASALADVSGTLTSTAQSFNNRQVDAGPAPARAVTLTSTGSDPLTVSGVTLTGAGAGQFAIADDTCSAAAPLTTGQTCRVLVAFDPSATGAHAAALEIATNGPTLASGALTGAGRDLDVSVASHDFGAVKAGSPSTPFVVTITNRDAAAYTLGTLSATGFRVLGHSCAAALEQDASCTATLAFQPSGLGPVTGALSIASFGPAPVVLRGEGVQPAASITPAGREFGVRAPAAGTSPAQLFTVRNTGNAPLAVGAVALDGASAGAFALVADTCSGQSVAPGATCAVGVAFAPVVAGWRSATLRVPADTDGPVLVARVSGRGAGAGLDTAPLRPADLAAQPLARLHGDGDDGVGASLAPGACDVDGDGIDDVLVGAPTWSTRPAERSWEGAAYVVFGGAGTGATDLAAPGVLRIEGTGAGSQAGSAVACAGDVNGDGIDDIAIGAWAHEYPGRPAGNDAARGAAYVVFGAADLRTAGPLDAGLLGDRGYRIVAPDAPEYDHLGYALAGLGDVTGDGRADLALQANTGDSTTFDPPRANNGITWVVRGQAGTRDVDVSDEAILTIHGSGSGQPNDLANVGDVNGDGTADIGIGVYTAVYAGRSTASGAAYVVSGRRRGAVDLADPASTLLFVGGPHAGQRLGTGIDGAGDVDGDGLGDVVIGADATSAANSDNAYVVYGVAEPAVLDAARLDGMGYRILGMPGASSGYGVAGVGDVNGDGLDDVAVGAYAVGAGSAYVVHGVADPGRLPANDATSGLVPVNPADRTHYVSLATLTRAQGSRIDGATLGERFGRQVAGIGDIDGNGAADLAIGSDFAFRLGRAGAGEVSVVLLPGTAPAAPVDPAPAPTPTPVPPPQVPVAPAATPRLALAQATLRADARFRVKLQFRCAAADCRGTAFLTLGGKRGAAKPVRVAAGRSVSVRVPLTKAQRRVLRRRGEMKGRLTVVVGGVRRTVGVTVRAPKGGR
jgi:hypothetical protein